MSALPPKADIQTEKSRLKWRNEGGNGGAGVDRPILGKLVAEVRQFHNRDFIKAAMAP